VENTHDNSVPSYHVSSSNDDIALLSSSSSLSYLIQQKQEELENHITQMIGVLVFGCGIPGIIRLIGMIIPNLAQNALTYIVAIALLSVLVHCYVRRTVTTSIRVVPSLPSPVPTVELT
jgi:hypothetical protein